MLKKIILCIIILPAIMFGFFLFSKIDKILGYPIATIAFDSELENYKDSNFKNCEEIMVNKSNEKSLHIAFLNIKKGTSKCIIDLLEKEKKDLLEIEYSFGGLKLETLYLSEYIYENNIKVKIKKSCQSACAYLLMASKKSTVCENSEIGIHQSDIKDDILSKMNKIISVIEPVTVYTFKKIKKYNVSISYLDNILSKTPPETMYYLNHNTETTQYGFADNIEQCDDSILDFSKFSKVI